MINGADGSSATNRGAVSLPVTFDSDGVTPIAAGHWEGQEITLEANVLVGVTGSVSQIRFAHDYNDPTGANAFDIPYAVGTQFGSVGVTTGGDCVCVPIMSIRAGVENQEGYACNRICVTLQARNVITFTDTSAGRPAFNCLWQSMRGAGAAATSSAAAVLSSFTGVTSAFPTAGTTGASYGVSGGSVTFDASGVPTLASGGVTGALARASGGVTAAMAGRVWVVTGMYADIVGDSPLSSSNNQIVKTVALGPNAYQFVSDVPVLAPSAL